MLNSRQEKIIMIMSENKKWIIGREMANLFQVSDRTIRGDVAKINSFYDDTIINSNPRLGYKININKINLLNNKNISIVPQKSDERCIYIIESLLFNKDKINIFDLKCELFISESCLENDIKKVKSYFKGFNTLNIKKQNNLMVLEGKESEKRQLFKNILMEKAKKNFLNLNRLSDLFKDFNLIHIKTILENIFEEFNYEVNGLVLPKLIIEIGVMIQRISKYNYININKEIHSRESNVEKKISNAFLSKLKTELGIKFIDDEVEYLSMMLLGKKSSSSELIIDERRMYSIKNLVDDIIYDINKNFDIDFSEDYDFKIGLEMHIISLIDRHFNNIKIDNIYLDEIKRKYPLIFDMSVRVGKVLEDKINIHIKENELSFIALHLGAVYERRSLNYKYKAIVIYPNNQTIGNLCLQKIINRFGERIEIVATMNFFEKSEVKKHNPDLIISTFPLEHSLDILTIEVSLFLNYEDENNIFRSLNKLEEDKYKRDFQLLLANLMKRDFFYTGIKANDYHDIISIMCDDLYKNDYVTESFKESVLKREEISSTSFVYGFAVPHSINISESKKSVLSVAILDTPVKWDKFDVRLVILLSIGEENRKVLRYFFDWISTIISNSSKYSRILEVKNYEEFIGNILM